MGLGRSACTTVGSLSSGGGQCRVSDAGCKPRAFLAAPRDGVAYHRGTQQAQRLIEQMKWAEAEELLKQLVRQYPFDTGTSARTSNWGRLGQALREQKKHREAIQAYEKVIELQGPGPSYPGLANARYWIAASHAALGDPEAALKALEMMVSDDRYLARPGLLSDPVFAGLRERSKYRAIAGVQNVSGLSRIEGWRRDVDHLVAELRRNNPPSAPIPQEFFRLARELKAAVPRLDDQKIVTGMGKMINVLHRGHTAIWFGQPNGPTKMSFKPLPFRFYVFPEGAFITQAFGEHKALAGAQILKIGEAPFEEALRKAASAASAESSMESLWQAPDHLIRPALLKGLSLSRFDDRAELTLKMPSGNTVVKTLRTIDEPQLGRLRGKLAPPPNVQAPLFLRQVENEVHWFEAIPDRSAIYVQVNNMAPDEGETLPEFGLRLRTALEELKPRSMVLDLRHNNGGNSFSYVELLRTITGFSTRSGNKVYALIGRNVYSAAGNFTTDLERLVQPIFVGEPTSQFGNQWGDESMFVLPYSGITGALAGVRWQLSHPWDHRRSIVPHVPVQLTARAYFQGEDPALDAVYQLMAESR